MNPKKAISALKAFEIEDVTPQIREDVDSTLTEDDKHNRWQMRVKRKEKEPEWAELKDFHRRV
jgi:hypothetical protein